MQVAQFSPATFQRFPRMQLWIDWTIQVQLVSKERLQRNSSLKWNKEFILFLSCFEKGWIYSKEDQIFLRALPKDFEMAWMVLQKLAESARVIKTLSVKFFCKNEVSLWTNLMFTDIKSCKTFNSSTNVHWSQNRFSTKFQLKLRV